MLVSLSEGMGGLEFVVVFREPTMDMGICCNMGHYWCLLTRMNLK